MLLPYFYIFFHKGFRLNMLGFCLAYVGSVLVPIALPCVWILLMLLNFNDLFLRIISIPSRIFLFVKS